jgi:hypothetical protein
MDKSPFYVIQEFISPLVCEDLVDDADFNHPDVDKDQKPVLTKKRSDIAEQVVFDRVRQVTPAILAHYGNLQYRGTERVSFEWIAAGCAGIAAHCENSERIERKWVRMHARDLTCVLFLSDLQDQPGFDDTYECYGGKLEFPQHYFGFNPQRGTLVVFPSEPHFINQTTPVVLGNLYQARFHIACQSPFLYNPKDFPGNYITWFK